MYLLILFLALSSNLKSSSFDLCKLNKNDTSKACKTPSLLNNTDTIKYLQEVVARKQQYIGKELNALVKDLSLQPLFFLYDVGGPNYTESTSLHFYYFKGDETHKRIKAHAISGRLIIHWQKPMNMDSIIAYSRKNGRHWNSAAEKFYGKQIIKDIELQ